MSRTPVFYKMLRRILQPSSFPNYQHRTRTLPTLNRRVSSRIGTLRFSDEEKRSFYEYTGGRWLWNEKEQLNARRVEFDVDALQRVACKAFGAASCLSFSKLDEGSYNKIFLLRFDNDREAIARIPCPLAGPPFIATASEVATMQFAREILKIPTPRVLAWSGRPTNPVGAEYIIMEKAPGIDLRTRWPLINHGPDIQPLVDDFIDVEQKFEGVAFSQVGSLYFKEDVSPELRDRPLFSDSVDVEGDETFKAAAERYRIGPLTDRQWWRGGRAELDIDRGPWLEPLSYFLAAVRCELTFIGSPAASSMRFRQNPFVPLSLYKGILNLCLKVFPLVMPPAELCTPTLWHPDLSEANIMVAPTSGANITSVIDWQYTQITPYFTQALFPSVFRYDEGVLPVPLGLKFPKLPDYDAYPPEQRNHIRRHHRLIMRQRVYENLHFRRGTARRKAANKIFQAAALTMLHWHVLRSWSHGPHIMINVLGDIADLWDIILPDAGIPCPMDEVSTGFKAEVDANKSLLEDLVYYDESVTTMTKALGCSGDGLVGHDEYLDTSKECERLRVIWDQHAAGKPFPFQDGMFSFFLS